MKDLLLTVFGIAALCAIIYGVYWIGKTMSYSFFYEDMVIESIKETVKLNCIK